MRSATVAPRAFLADFGLARDTATGSALTRTGVTLGTPAYMSPELARGEFAALTPASDAWALGCVLHELLAGAPAFGGDTPAATIAQVVAGRPARLPSGVPDACRRLRHAALRPAPAHRYPRARALVDDCARALAGAPVLGVPAPRGARLAALAAAAVLAGLAWWAWPRPAARPDAAGAATLETLLAQAQGLRAGDPGAARALLHRALATAPRHPDADDWRLDAGLLAWTQGDTEGALADWAGVPPDSAAGPDVAAAAMLLHFVERDPADVATQFRAAVARGGRPARLARAIASLRLGEFHAVGPALAGEGGWEAALLRGAAARARGPVDWAVVEAEFGAALAAGAPPALAWIGRGEARLERGDARGALEDGGVVVRRRPELSTGWRLRGQARLRLGEREAGLADLDRYVAMRPDDAVALELRGRARLDAGDAAGADADLARSLALAPANAGAWSLRGDVAWGRGDGDAALAHYAQALACDPGFLVAVNNRAAVRLARGDHAGAIADWTRCIDADPHDAAALNNRAVARAELGEVAAALQDWDRALAARPEYPEVLGARAEARAEVGDLDGALADADRLVALLPDDMQALLLRASVHRGRRSWAAALADAERAGAAAPNDPAPLLALAMVREGLGEWAAAAEAYRAFLRRAPPDDEAVPRARDWLAQAEARAR